MTPNPAQYGSGIISSRSRRLRTIAAVLLIGIIAMAVYGTRILVPGINRAARAAVKPAIQSSVISTPHDESITPLKLTKREAQILRLDVMFEAVYWVVWIVMIVSLLLVAWMDLREVSRTYLNQRRELWAVAAKAALKDSPPGRVGSEANPDARHDSNDSSNPPVVP